MLRERNKQYGTIKFVDISTDEYSPEDNQGLDYETVCSLSIFSPTLVLNYFLLFHLLVMVFCN